MTTPPSRTPLRMLLLSMTLALAKNSSCPSLTTMSTRGCTDLCQDEAVVCMFYSNVEDCTDNLLGQCIQDSSNNCSVKCMKTNFWGGLIFEIPTDTIMDTVGSMDSNFLTRLTIIGAPESTPVNVTIEDEALMNATALARLEMINVNLTDQLPAGKMGKQLEQVKMQQCLLQEFPPDLFECENLTALNVRKNEISLLPENITRWSKLEYLNIANNEFGQYNLSKDQFDFLSRVPLLAFDKPSTVKCSDGTTTRMFRQIVQVCVATDEGDDDTKPTPTPKKPSKRLTPAQPLPTSQGRVVSIGVSTLALSTLVAVTMLL